MKEIIDINFEVFEFPEYKPIAYAIIEYINENDIIDESPYHIPVMVDEKSVFAKGHDSEDDTGFIMIFVLLFKVDDDEIKLTKIQVNPLLVTEKINLTTGKKKYPLMIEEEIETDIENTDQCPICLSNKGELVETPCAHKFHLTCLRCVPKLRCPVCRADIIDFLKEQNVPEDEITERLNDQEREEELMEHLELISDVDSDVENINDLDFLRMCMETLKLNNGDPTTYNDLIFAMNANASKLFAEISYIKSKKGKGAFVYIYESPAELILQMIDPSNPSSVMWVSQSTFKGTPADDKINEISDTKEEYVVIVAIDDIADARLVSKDAYTDELNHRISQKDILHSLLKCSRCECSSPAPYTPNREYRWARSVLRNMKRTWNKNKKRRNKPLKTQHHNDNKNNKKSKATNQ